MSILSELAAFTAAMNEQGVDVRVDLATQMQESIDNARNCGVKEENIIHNVDELNSFLGF